VTFLAEDRQRLEAFRRGDAWALTDVYRHYAPFVFSRLRDGFAIGRQGSQGFFPGLKDLATRENMAQEIFVRAFTEAARTRYDGLRPYRNYLGTILRNLVIDELRKHREFVAWEESEAEGDMPVGGLEPPDAALDRQELQKAVRNFEATLNDRERRILTLRFRQGCSLESVVKETGLTDYRVKQTEKAIRKRFLAYMHNHGFLEGHTDGEVMLGLGWFLLLWGGYAA